MSESEVERRRHAGERLVMGDYPVPIISRSDAQVRAEQVGRLDDPDVPPAVE